MTDDYEAYCKAELALARSQRDKYKIVRMYFRGGKRTIMTGLTLDEAQAHCSNPETSSSTATSLSAKRRTAAKGPWFDGYERD